MKACFKKHEHGGNCDFDRSQNLNTWEDRIFLEMRTLLIEITSEEQQGTELQMKTSNKITTLVDNLID